MLKKLLLFCTLLSLHWFNAQYEADTAYIKNDIYKISELMIDKDIDKLIEFTYPKIFETFPKEFFSEYYNSLLFGNEEIEIRFQPIDNSKINIDNFQIEDSITYGFVDYPVTFDMRFLDKEFTEDEKEKLILFFNLKGFKLLFLDNQTAQISNITLMVAIKDPAYTNEWKYLTYDKGNVMINKILPENIINKGDKIYTKIQKQKENAY